MDHLQAGQVNFVLTRNEQLMNYRGNPKSFLGRVSTGSDSDLVGHSLQIFSDF
jgi:hypothetical protein